MSSTKTTIAKLGGMNLGPGLPVRILAAINISPESFYKGSVATTEREISSSVRTAVEDGADFIDIGGMSTAPYLKTEVPQEVEVSRVKTALRVIAETGAIAATRVSVDTLRASVAQVALENGASIINDVSGLKNDPLMAGVVRQHRGSLLAMAHSAGISSLKPIIRVRRALQETLGIAARAGIETSQIVLDPGIGFYREEGAGKAYSPQNVMPWYRWDCEILANLRELEPLRRPLCLGVSRKSFIGKILGLKGPEERLSGSLAATTIAVMNGAHLIRTHDVRETVHAVRVAEAIVRRRRLGRRASRAS